MKTLLSPLPTAEEVALTRHKTGNTHVDADHADGAIHSGAETILGNGAKSPIFYNSPLKALSKMDAFKALRLSIFSF